MGQHHALAIWHHFALDAHALCFHRPQHLFQSCQDLVLIQIRKGIRRKTDWYLDDHQNLCLYTVRLSRHERFAAGYAMDLPFLIHRDDLFIAALPLDLFRRYLRRYLHIEFLFRPNVDENIRAVKFHRRFLRRRRRARRFCCRVSLGKGRSRHACHQAQRQQHCPQLSFHVLPPLPAFFIFGIQAVTISITYVKNVSIQKNLFFSLFFCIFL